MSEEQIRRVEEFVSEHYGEFITFAEARALATSGNVHCIAGYVVGGTLRSLRIWRRRRKFKTT